MAFFTDNIGLIVLLPLWIFFIILSGVFFRLTENNKITFILSLFSTIIGMVFSLSILNNIQGQNVAEKTFRWLGTDNIQINLGTYVDSVSAMFLTVFLILSLFVQIYTYGYMKNNVNKPFLILNLLNFVFSGMILSPNIIQFLIFSILLTCILIAAQIFLEEDRNEVAHTKIFPSLSGDIFLFIGVVILTYFASAYMNMPTDTFLSFSNTDFIHNQLLSLTSQNVYNLIIFIFILSAFIKIIQISYLNYLTFNLHIPFYALINSVYTILCGIYLLIRIHPLLSKQLLCFIVIAGIVTALVSSVTAIAQINLKKMTSYITSSLSGLILISVGYSVINAAIISSVIYIYTVVLLCLILGNIYKIYGTYDAEKISGLKKTDYFLSVYLLVALLSVSGIFLGGATAKELIIGVINNRILMFAVLFVLYVNSYTVFKVYFKITEGEQTSEKIENISSNTLVLRILCIFVIFPGFLFNISKINMLTFITTIICFLGALNAYYDNKTGKEMLILSPLIKFIRKQNPIRMLPTLTLFNYIDNYGAGEFINFLSVKSSGIMKQKRLTAKNKLIYTIIFIVIMMIISFVMQYIIERGV